MIEGSPYTLDAVQLEKAVQALQKAAETLRPTPSEERLYRVLGICVKIAVAAFAGMILANISIESSGLIPGVYDIKLFFAIVFLLAAGGAVVFLLLNQSVVRHAFRQRRLLKNLGIREV